MSKGIIHSTKYEKDQKSSSHQYVVLELERPMVENSLVGPLRTCEPEDKPPKLGNHVGFRLAYLDDKLMVKLTLQPAPLATFN